MAPERLKKEPRECQSRSKLVSQPCRTPTSIGKRVQNRFRDNFRYMLCMKTGRSSSANFAQKSLRQQHSFRWRKCVSYRKIQCPRPIRTKAVSRDRLQNIEKNIQKVGSKRHPCRACWRSRVGRNFGTKLDTKSIEKCVSAPSGGLFARLLALEWVR